MSMALSFARLTLGIIENNLYETMEAVKELNALNEDSYDTEFVVNIFDLQIFAQKFDNECFNYFLMNVENQTVNRELWIFLSGYIPGKYRMNRITKEQIKTFIKNQMDINYNDNLREIKYFTLIRFAMLIEDYETIREIRTRLEAIKNG